MAAQIGYFDTLKNAAGKVFTYLSSITLTGTDGKTLTVTQDTTLDEAVAMSSKAPKGNPVFTGDVLNNDAGASMGVKNPTNVAITHVGALGGVVGVPDNAIITITTSDTGAAFIIFNSSNGAGAMFHVSWNSATITKISDPGSGFEITDTDTGKICVFKGASSHVISIKNYTNAQAVLYITALGVIASATAPA